MVTVNLCGCERCGWLWLVPVVRELPRRCSSCKARTWNSGEPAADSAPRVAVLGNDRRPVAEASGKQQPERADDPVYDFTDV